MEVRPVTTFKNELRNIEETVTQASTEVLNEQEQRYQTTINEITQSIVSVSNGQDFIKLYKGDQQLSDVIDENESLVIDPRNLKDNLLKVNKLVELLKLTYLEKDTLDYFLRYTLTSTNLLALESEDDPKFLELQKQVASMEQNALIDKLQSVENAKEEILNKNKELSMKQDQINNMYLDTTGIIDDCWEMLDELETLKRLQNENTISNKDAAPDNKVEKDNDAEIIKETYEEWQTLKMVKSLENKLNSELAQVQQIRDEKNLNSDMKSKGNFDTNEVLTVQGETLTKLIRLWNNYFLPSSNLPNSEEKTQSKLRLEIFPQTRKFQFNLSNKYVVVFELNDDVKNSVKDIRFFEKNADSMVENFKLRSEYLNKFNKPISNHEIFWVMEDILRNVI
ncbi:hypothetical protein TPHA_0E03880 [Tetrapisispora phaffii CBS 4417]|uniref:Spindle pole body component KRE28 n=1 Tax=Tetrapisispora phaffii (strain ATCC 24235 / CBS 4417 / NBRC 1672 / NRRL Y-8282 / UCD 70-5) TaxID=1071381 RepID=G8BU99_TETPH|nr:hypothetical protein TPHA_0E03880 [Tetrapisispora phaffii CBS 4417]CCE63477.1 hypothetical protein TPHA_0E03880 [Tetrapisispora phaffii CBS 4417]